MQLLLKSYRRPFAKTTSRQQEVDCGNLQAGEMNVPPLGASTKVDFLDLTWLTMGVEGADFLTFTLLVPRKTHRPR